MNERSFSFYNTMKDKRVAILESALGLIRNQGFHGASMSLVAKNADVATGTVYNYFDNKEHLIKELYNHNRQLLLAVVNETLLEQNDATFRQRFDKTWLAIYGFYVENPDMLIFVEQFVNSPFCQHKHVEEFEERPLLNFLRSGADEKIFKALPAEVLLTYFFSSCVYMAKLHLYGNATLSQTDTENALEMIWDGLCIHDNQ